MPVDEAKGQPIQAQVGNNAAGRPFAFSIPHFIPPMDPDEAAPGKMLQSVDYETGSSECRL